MSKNAVRFTRSGTSVFNRVSFILSNRISFLSYVC